eukprot:15660287-Heterocapsa_arctica.AAC.1
MENFCAIRPLPTQRERVKRTLSASTETRTELDLLDGELGFEPLTEIEDMTLEDLYECDWTFDFNDADDNDDEF